MLNLALLGDGLTTESRQLFQAMTTQPAPSRKRVINTLIATLKNAGVWNLIDAMYVLAAADTQAARLNWKAPGTFTLSLVNSPTFLADRGYTSDGATSYLTGPNLSTFGGAYAQNNAHMGVWVGTNVVENLTDIGQSANAFIRTQRSANTPNCRANDGTTSSGGSANAIGHTLWTRSGSASYDVYKNASSFNAVVASTGVQSQVIGLCAAGNGTAFSTKRIQAGHVGAALTAQQITDLYNALSAYMTAVGA